MHIIPPATERHPPHTASICMNTSRNELFTFPEVSSKHPTNIPHIILPSSTKAHERAAEGDDVNTRKVIISEDVAIPFDESQYNEVFFGGMNIYVKFDLELGEKRAWLSRQSRKRTRRTQMGQTFVEHVHN